MAYGDYRDLPRRKVSDKVLGEKVFNIAKNPKYDGCQFGLAWRVYEFLIKSFLVVVLKVKLCQIKN